MKKTIALAQEKLDKEETKLDIKTKIIANSIIEIFELPLESLTYCNFLKKFARKIWKKIDKMSKEFKVLNHACGYCYYDGTLPLISKHGGCSRPTVHPFWKDPKDIKNTFRKGNQRKNLHIAPESYIDAYYNTKKQ